MPKLIFAREVKYKTRKYPAGIVVDVDEVDVKSMQAAGGWILRKESDLPEPPKLEPKKEVKKTQKVKVAEEET